jgi:hypothetical protein
MARAQSSAMHHIDYIYPGRPPMPLSGDGGCCCSGRVDDAIETAPPPPPPPPPHCAFCLSVSDKCRPPARTPKSPAAARTSCRQIDRTQSENISVFSLTQHIPLLPKFLSSSFLLLPSFLLFRAVSRAETLKANDSRRSSTSATAATAAARRTNIASLSVWLFSILL